MSLMRRKEKKVHWSMMKVIMLMGLILYTVCLFSLLIWAVITSFKSQSDFRINTLGLPKEWVWNYSLVLSKFNVRVNTDEGIMLVGIGRLFLNSLMIAGGCAFFNTLSPCIVSYLCARYNFKMSKIIYTAVIVAMVLPIVGSLPSEIAMSHDLGIYDHIWGFWIMKAHFLGMGFLIFYGTFKHMPMAYSEAAKIDGASNMQILTKIMLPLAKNTFFTILLIRFIEFWNEYQGALLYLPSHPTVSLGLYYMANTPDNEMVFVPMRMTASVMVLLPIIILFVSFSKRLLGNLTVGGIKG